MPASNTHQRGGNIFGIASMLSLTSFVHVMNTGGYGPETIPHDSFEDDKHGWWKNICHAGST